MNCQEMSELEESYLQAELETTQMKRVEAHLKSCADCRQRLSGYEELLGRLFATIKPLPPAPRLRTAILAQAEASRPLLKEPTALPLFQKARLRPRPKFSLLYNVAATLLLLGLVGVLLLMVGQLQSLNTQRATDQAMLALTSSPDSRIWIMTQANKPNIPNGPSAKMYVQPGSSFYLITATNLPPAPAGQVYRAWYVEEGQAQFAGELQTDRKGNASLKVTDSELSPVPITACYITLEDSHSQANPVTNPVPNPFLEWKSS